MPRMVEVVIDSVRVSLTNQQRIVVLREVNEERYLPIWIGPYEAEAITIALQEIEVARPQTHDLVKNILTNLNARITRVEVIALRDDVFFGNVVLEVNGMEINIDSRPSDALALAVRAHVSILVSREVMDAAGITPERDLQDESQSMENSPLEGSGPDLESEDSENRLSVFEDFLEKLDLGGDNPAPTADNNPEEDPSDPDRR